MNPETENVNVQPQELQIKELERPMRQENYQN